MRNPVLPHQANLAESCHEMLRSIHIASNSVAVLQQLSSASIGFAGVTVGLEIALKIASTNGVKFNQGTLSKLNKQTTLGSPVETDGIGLHTGVEVKVRLLPAPPDTGYVFRRTDLGGFEIPATVESVAHCGYATTLMRTGVMLSTVEHLLAALRGANVDNVYIEVDNLEIPILDGSAEVFTDMIGRAGVVEQSLARRALLVRERVSFEQGNRRISVEPADNYEIDCLIDFPHPLIGVQRFALQLANGAFSREIAAARTFGFTDEIEALQRSNLIRGGSLDNAIVLTPDGMLNQTACVSAMSLCAIRYWTSSVISPCWACRFSVALSPSAAVTYCTQV